MAKWEIYGLFGSQTKTKEIMKMLAWRKNRFDFRWEKGPGGVGYALLQKKKGKK